MPKITRDEVLHVANLARLEMDAPEIEKLSGQLGEILSYMDTLNQVDTQGVLPTSHTTSRSNAFRPDKAAPGLKRDDALANAPVKEQGAFLVPKVIG